jgi:hypothetical protein
LALVEFFFLAVLGRHKAVVRGENSHLSCTEDLLRTNEREREREIPKGARGRIALPTALSIAFVWVPLLHLLISGLQGWSLFSEGTSAKWIFDVEIDEFGADIFLVRLEDQNNAWRLGKFLNRSFEAKIL